MRPVEEISNGERAGNTKGERYESVEKLCLVPKKQRMVILAKHRKHGVEKIDGQRIHSHPVGKSSEPGRQKTVQPVGKNKKRCYCQYDNDASPIPIISEKQE